MNIPIVLNIYMKNEKEAEEKTITITKVKQKSKTPTHMYTHNKNMKNKGKPTIKRTTTKTRCSLQTLHFSHHSRFE